MSPEAAAAFFFMMNLFKDTLGGFLFNADNKTLSSWRTVNKNTVTFSGFLFFVSLGILTRDYILHALLFCSSSYGYNFFEWVLQEESMQPRLPLTCLAINIFSLLFIIFHHPAF